MKKLSDNDVYYIRELKKHGVRNSDLAKLFGVSRIHIWRIVKGKSRNETQRPWFVNTEKT